MKNNKLVFGFVVLILIATGYFLISRILNKDTSEITSPSSTTTLSIPPKFVDYPADLIFKGTPVAVNLSSNPIGQTFKTVLTRGAKKGPNFAGHYTVVDWGCGSSCQSFAIIDAETGKIFTVSFPSENGQEYQLNSRLLIVNPLNDVAVSDYEGAPEWIRAKYFEWTGTELKLLKVYKITDNQLVEAGLLEGDPSIPDWMKQSQSCETIGGQVFCK